MDQQLVRDLVIGFIVVSALVLITALTVFIYKRKAKGKRPELPSLDYHYNLRPLLMTKAESFFYFKLTEIIPDGFVIVPQMPFSSVIDRPSSPAANSKIDRKIIDYGIFKTVKPNAGSFKSLAPVLLIELDDESHKESHRIRRDGFIDAVCEQIELPILHVPKAEDYNMGALRRQILNLIK